jgi:hypothetical protein
MKSRVLLWSFGGVLILLVAGIAWWAHVAIGASKHASPTFSRSLIRNKKSPRAEPMRPAFRGGWPGNGIC